MKVSPKHWVLKGAVYLAIWVEIQKGENAL